MLGADVTTTVLDFLIGGELPLGLNDTAITLIPKVRNPQKISQFRPIALCPVLYKIAAKANTNHMRNIMEEVIGDEQSAFVPVRLITDIVFVAYECVHAILNRKRKKPLCAVKLDMMKAYDRVEWIFLEQVLNRVGFDAQWIAMIM